MAARVVTAIASTNPVTFFATLSTRGWCGVGLCAVEAGSSPAQVPAKVNPMGGV